MRFLVDVSAVLWQGLLQGTDHDTGYEVKHEGKNVWVNGADHGYHRAMNKILGVLERFRAQPHQLILVAEGKFSKGLRLAIDPDYKGNRDSKRPDAAYSEFHALKARFLQAWLDVGAQTVTQDHVEGDDVIAYLSRRLRGNRDPSTGLMDTPYAPAPGLSSWRSLIF